MKVAFLSSGSSRSVYLASKISREFGLAAWIVENMPFKAKLRILLRRRKHIGWTGVLGIVLYRIYTKFFDKHPKVLPDTEPPKEKPLVVNSVNQIEGIEAVRRAGADICIVYCTGIIRNPTIQQLPEITINLHGGISEKYRGSNCCLWAIAKGDFENVGITLHRVASGVDTGQIFRHAPLEVNKDDTGISILQKQAVVGWPPIKEILEEFDHTGTINAEHSTELSKGDLYFTPTLSQYLHFKKVLRNKFADQ